MKKLFVAMILAFVFTACGEDGKTGLTALTSFIEEEAGENCANGGMKVETGLDKSRDGILNENEIQDTRYICNGESGTDGVDGSDGTDGEKGDKGDPGTDGTDGTDGEKGDKGDPGTDGTDGTDGVDGVCAENNPPVINSIKIKGTDYAETPVQITVSKDFSVFIDATDGDSDPLIYSISGGFLDITDNGNGDYTFNGDTKGVFHFSVIVSDGCQMAVKDFAVEIISITVVYSGANRNIVFSEFNNPGTISLFNATETWDDITLVLDAMESPSHYTFGSMLQSFGNYVKFAYRNDINYIKNFSLGDEIGSSQTFMGDNWMRFSCYDEIDMGFINNGEFRNTTGYAGLKFTDATDIYYGWIQVSVTNYNNSNITGTLIDWAYNSTPGEPIPAGFTGE